LDSKISTNFEVFKENEDDYMLLVSVLLFFRQKRDGKGLGPAVGAERAGGGAWRGGESSFCLEFFVEFKVSGIFWSFLWSLKLVSF
jgi:hypothetical protein